MKGKKEGSKTGRKVGGLDFCLNLVEIRACLLKILSWVSTKKYRGGVVHLCTNAIDLGRFRVMDALERVERSLLLNKFFSLNI